MLCDLGSENWPFEDSSVEVARASHVLEHLPGESFFHFMRELYRVLKPGGKAEVVVPHPRHDVFLNDPTHARPVSAQTMLLFSRRYLDECAADGDILTPFARLHGVDFDVKRVVYGIDGKLAPDMLAKVQANLAFYEKFIPNTIIEIFINMEAVK